MANTQTLSPDRWEVLRQQVGANKNGLLRMDGRVYYLAKTGKLHLSVEHN
jgi:glucan-binding YG repeat protein